MPENQIPVQQTMPAVTPMAPVQASQPVQGVQPAQAVQIQVPAEPSKYLEMLFGLMEKYNSSDIYLTYGEEPTIRVYWEAKRLQWVPKLDDKILNEFAEFMMSEEDKKNYAETLASDLGISMGGRRFRVNISRQRDHVMIVARLLEEKVPTIDEKKLPQIFKQLIQKGNGVIFMVWPTGSWKSTTLAAMVEEINMTKAKHIITIEDPIEYIFEPKKSIFEQKQLWKDITSFASAMKFALRQRPDVVLFGEIRDTDSVRNAIALAETGHLVMTTIHSRSAEQTVNKIISMFPADEQPQIRNQLSENFTAIIIQKLLKKADWSGMVPAHEILLNNIAVENTIRENKLNQIKNVMYTNRTQGMQLLEDNMAVLVEQWVITVEQALANANDTDHLKRELQSKGIQV